jgi:stage II sporulation protein M
MNPKKLNKKPQQKELSLKTQYKKAWSYLKETLPSIYIIIAIFFLFSFLGYILAPYLSFLDEVLKNLVKQAEGLNAIEMIVFILQNNLQSALLSFFLGFFLGIFPVLGAATNGLILGYVLNLATAKAGPLVALKLFPHGIFELPAIFISMGLGLKLGATFLTQTKNLKTELKRRFFSSANVLLRIVIPLLILAAIIEGLLIIFIG